VAQSEYELLSLAQGLWLCSSARLTESLIREPRKQPPNYSPQALALLRDTLAKGVVVGLARQGGVRARFNRPTGTGAGYWWQRNPVQRLEFTEQAMSLLRWILESVPQPAAANRLDLCIRETGDALLLYFVYARLVEHECHGAAVSSPAFRHSALCWLGYCDSLAKAGPLSIEELDRLDFEILLDEQAWLFEALQRPLTRRWLGIETGKSQIDDPVYMTDLGVSQARLLERLADAAARHKRLDLLSFVFQAGARILRNRPDPEYWVKNLPQTLALEQYTDAARASMALFEAVEACYPVIEDLAAARFFDEEYEYSQLVLKHWQVYGERGLEQARSLISQVSALDRLAGESA